MNKFTKYMSFAAVALMGGSLLTSCDYEKDSDFVDTYPGADAGGVYIPAEARTNVKVTLESSDYSFLIYRGQSSTELTVPVTVTPIDEYVIADAFSFEPTATFQVGDLTAPVNFTCDVAKLPEEEPQQFYVEIDPAYSTVYGPNAAIITITRWGKWNSLGTGYYIDQLWGISNYSTTAEVEFTQSEKNPNLFRISYPYEFDPDQDPDAYIEFQVLEAGQQILGQTVPYDDLVYYDDIVPENGIISYAFPGTVPGYTNPDTWTGNFVYEYQDNGLPAMIYLGPIVFYNGQTMNNFLTAGALQLIFPGVEMYDSSIQVEYNGMMTYPDETTSVLASVQFGADVTSAKVAVVPNSNIQMAVNQIVSGTMDALTIRNGGDITINFDRTNPTGKYAVLAISYVDDEPMQYATSTFNYSNSVQAADWTSLGYVDYTDAFMCSAFILTDDNFPYTWSVEIQENKSLPGYYRLVNAYGPDSPFAMYQGMQFTTAETYMEIDATDPDVVVLKENPQSLIVPDQQYGPLQLSTSMMAYYWLDRGISYDQLVDYGYYGFVDNNVIGFYPTTLATYLGDIGPIEANCILRPDASTDPNADAEDIYYGQYYQGQFIPYSCFEVDLNNIYATPQAAKAAASKAKAKAAGSRATLGVTKYTPSLSSHVLSTYRSSRDPKAMKLKRQGNRGIIKR